MVVHRNARAIADDVAAEARELLGQTRPWLCGICQTRAHWRRETIECPTHGTLATLADPGSVLS